MSVEYWDARNSGRYTPPPEYDSFQQREWERGKREQREERQDAARRDKEHQEAMSRIVGRAEDYSPVREVVIRVCCIFALSCIAGCFVNKGELLVGSFTFAILMAIYGLLTLASRSARSQPAPRVPVSREEHDKRMAAGRKLIEDREAETKRQFAKMKK